MRRWIIWAPSRPASSRSPPIWVNASISRSIRCPNSCSSSPCFDEDREQGREAAERQIGVNIVTVFALIAALTAGYMAMAPTFEALLVPQAYRGDYARLTIELGAGVSRAVHDLFSAEPGFPARQAHLAGDGRCARGAD